jgi:putative peptidoglycan lipid II flippase
MHFPLGVFAVAVGTAVLPRASAAVTNSDPVALQRTYDEGVLLAAFLVVPAAAFLLLFPDVVVAVIYQRGAFTASDTMNTSLALRMYALGLVGYTGVRVTAPIFYAHKDARTPMRFAMAAVVVNIVLNVVFASPLGFAGLALASAAAGTTNFTLLSRRLRKRYSVSPTPPTYTGLFRIGLDGLLACAVTFAVWRAWDVNPAEMDFGRRLLALLGLGVLFLVVYFWRAFITDSPQRRILKRLIRR